jgi:hypothetical protein
MAQCYSCQKKLGVFERTVKYGPERLPYCVPCATMKEKQEAMATLFEGGESKRIFRIPNVYFTDPYDVQMKTRLIGDLLFLDKAVCFVQTGQYQGSSNTTAFMFGLLGALIAGMQEKKAMKKAMEQVQLIQQNFPTTSLREIVERASRVIFFPKDSITEMKFSSWFGGFRIKTADKQQVFRMENGKKTFKEYEDKVREYQNQW